MNIDKTKILDLLRSRGEHDEVTRADEELPDQIDTDRDRGLLDTFGLSIGDIIKQLGGGGVGKLLG